MVLRGTTKRIENTIKNFSDVVYDPDSFEITTYDPDGILVNTETSPNRIGVGEYYFNYTVPADGVAGRWVSVWKTVYNSIDSIDRVAFSVETLSDPTRKEIRDFLDNMPEKRVPHHTIDLAIRQAIVRVNAIKSSKAIDRNLLEAEIAIAGLYAYTAYVAEVERSTGRVPAPVLGNLELYKLFAAQWEKIIKSAQGTPMIKTSGPVITMTRSITDFRDAGIYNRA